MMICASSFGPLLEFKKMIAVDRIDTDEPIVQALVASLFKVFKFQHFLANTSDE